MGTQCREFEFFSEMMCVVDFELRRACLAFLPWRCPPSRCWRATWSPCNGCWPSSSGTGRCPPSPPKPPETHRPAPARFPPDPLPSSPATGNLCKQNCFPPNIALTNQCLTGRTIYFFRGVVRVSVLPHDGTTQHFSINTYFSKGKAPPSKSMLGLKCS